MYEFMRKFTQLNGVGAKVILEHCLFDRQAFYCDKLKTINDDEKIGLVVKDRNIFLYKRNVKMYEHTGTTYVISDGRMKIKIVAKV